MQIMQIEKTSFGKLPGNEYISLYTLRNDNGMEVGIINYGATIVSLKVPGINGVPEDLVLGFDTLEEYAGDHPYIGAMVGRVCNRIGRSRFELDGRLFRLTPNEGKNQLHGGPGGFDRKVWSASPLEDKDRICLELGYVSPDGEEGFPGTLNVTVTYSLGRDNELEVRCRAKGDRPTHVNLTNHSYFNLNGCKGDILAHELFIDADSVTELDKENIPTGRILPVDGTPFDFREPKPIGREISRVAPGYDINYVLGMKRRDLSRAATLRDPASGRQMEVLTTLPGLQLYTSNYVNRIPGKGGKVYLKHSAVCLETQYFPDSCNQPDFPPTLIRPGELYDETTVFRFYV
jgi:aldose 1-epimerase